MLAGQAILLVIFCAKNIRKNNNAIRAATVSTLAVIAFYCQLQLKTDPLIRELAI